MTVSFGRASCDKRGGARVEMGARGKPAFVGASGDFCTGIGRMARRMQPRRISEASSRTEPQTKFGAWFHAQGPSRLMAQLRIIEKAANNDEVPIMKGATSLCGEKTPENKKSILCTRFAKSRLAGLDSYAQVWSYRETFLSRVGASASDDLSADAL